MLNKNQKVVVKAIIEKRFLEFAKVGTQFYLKKPRISLHKSCKFGFNGNGCSNIGLLKQMRGEYQKDFGKW